MFDKLTESPSALMMGGQALSGLYQANVAGFQNQLTQQNQAYQQGMLSYQMNNANSVAPIPLSATPITADQQAAAKLTQAQNAKTRAEAITGVTT